MFQKKFSANYISRICWLALTFNIFLYTTGLIGFYNFVMLKYKFLTYLWRPGVHRFFSHRSFKAVRPFKIYLIVMQTIAGQFSILKWVKVHRVHHKFTDTHKDPTNIKNGFFFAHFSWLFLKFNDECQIEYDRIDVNDLLNDKDVMFQHNNYYTLAFSLCVAFPTLVPLFCWNESLKFAFYANMFRWLLNWTQMGMANSCMHMFGMKPYDKHISATEHFLSNLFTLGEGYHNFHHTFPYDYRFAEFGTLDRFNISTVFLDQFAKLGWIYDMKLATPEMIKKRALKTGDGNWTQLENEIDTQ